jgi:hypothetical protein
LQNGQSSGGASALIVLPHLLHFQVVMSASFVSALSLPQNSSKIKAGAQ